MAQFDTTLQWDGDTGGILPAAKAAYALLVAEGRGECEMRIYAEFPTLPPPARDTRHRYKSFEEAEAAIRAAGEAPSFLAVLMHLDRPSLAFEVEPSVTGGSRSHRVLGGLRVHVRSDQGARLAERLHNVAVRALRSPDGELERLWPSDGSLSIEPRSGALGWIEAHPALITLIGIIVAAVVAIVVSALSG